MDLDMQSWMAALTAALRQAFGARLVCVGLQGSRARRSWAAERHRRGRAP